MTAYHADTTNQGRTDTCGRRSFWCTLAASAFRNWRSPASSTPLTGPCEARRYPTRNRNAMSVASFQPIRAFVHQMAAAGTLSRVAML